MTKLTPAQFFTRAIERVPSRNFHYPECYGHLGVRLNLLRRPFARYYGDELNFTETLDSLIKDKVVVAVHLKWGGQTDARKPVEVERLESFPDKLVLDEDPILYLPHAVPKALRSRLNRDEEVLAKILEPILLVVNG